MTLTVKPNSDGTITVTCGGDSVTIAAPGPAADANPPRGLSPFPWPVVVPKPLPPPPEGGQASIVSNRKAKTKVVVVSDEADLLRHISELYGLDFSEPTIYQYHIGKDELLNAGKLNKVLSDIGNPDLMGIQLMPGGLGDE